MIADQKNLMSNENAKMALRGQNMAIVSKSKDYIIDLACLFLKMQLVIINNVEINERT